jgi:hypothetical protein
LIGRGVGVTTAVAVNVAAAAGPVGGLHAVRPISRKRKNRYWLCAQSPFAGEMAIISLIFSSDSERI